MFSELVLKTRSYRWFHQDVPVDRQTLRELVDLARHSASSSNRQPLKFVLCCDPETNARVFPCTAWAGFLNNRYGPAEGEWLAAYTIILGDTEIREPAGGGHGIAAQSIVLGATEKGLGGCMIGSIDRPKLREALSIPERYEILLALALDKPNEAIALEDLGLDGNTKYYRNEQDVHPALKRTPDEIILD